MVLVFYTGSALDGQPYRADILFLRSVYIIIYFTFYISFYILFVLHSRWAFYHGSGLFDRLNVSAITDVYTQA